MIIKKAIKTELAINYALQIKQSGYKTALVDIDGIKPAFRSREQKVLLEQSGIVVIVPDQQFAQAELPVLPHQLMKVLYDKECQVVIDVGGGESAIVLGQFCQRFTELSYEALLVVNTLRPFTTTVAVIRSLSYILVPNIPGKVS